MSTITIEGEADRVLYELLDAIEGYNIDVVVNEEPLGTVHGRGLNGWALVFEKTDDGYYEPTGERIASISLSSARSSLHDPVSAVQRVGRGVECGSRVR